MAKPIPCAPNLWLKIAVLIPISSPRALDEGAAGISRVDGGVGLNEVFESIEPDTVAPGRTDDAHGDGLADIERVADGEHDVTHAYGRHVGDPDAGKPGDGNLQNGNIGIPVFADEQRLAAAAIRQRNQYFIGAIDDVLIGENISFGADDDTGAEVGFAVAALPALQLIAEKLAEHRVIE